MRNAARRPPAVSLAAIWVGYLALWSLANWPALTTAWWVNDDYAILVRFAPLHNLQLGRPLEALHHWLLTWEAAPGQQWLNPVLRYGQGMLHCTTAVLAGWLLYRVTRRRHVWGYMLLFVLWPFHGEAVLWRASAIALGAALSMSGLTLISHAKATANDWRRGIGVLAIAAAVLAHQLAALAALVLWVMATTLGDPAQRPPRWRELRDLVTGYILGGALSLLLIRYSTADLGRATLTTAWLAKAFLAAKLNGFLLIAPVYPRWMQGAHLVFLGTTVAVMVNDWLTQHRLRWLPMLSVLSLTLLPYIPLLLVAETLLAPRNLYLGPFLFVGAALVIDRFATRRVRRGCQTGLALLLILGYLPLSWRNSAEFPQLYAADQQTLATVATTIRAAALSAPESQLVIATAPDYLRTWNPYGLHLPWGDAKKSAFLAPWAAPAFVQWQSSLTVLNDPLDEQWCVALCQQQSDPKPFALLRAPQSPWCLCP